MQKHKIIFDEDELDRFIDWLPRLERSECFYFHLLIKKKYSPVELNIRHTLLDRFVGYKKNIKKKIKRLEIPLGEYVIDGVTIPPECLVLYMHPNPRCHQKAAKNMIKTLVDKVTKEYDNFKIDHVALTELHTAKSRSFVVDFDFDDVEYEVVKSEIDKVINEDAYAVVKTAGGFHLMVTVGKVSPEFKRIWHNGLDNIGADAVGDNMIPVPGTIQGNHIVHFIKKQ